MGNPTKWASPKSRIIRTSHCALSVPEFILVTRHDRIIIRSSGSPVEPISWNNEFSWEEKIREKKNRSAVQLVISVLVSEHQPGRFYQKSFRDRWMNIHSGEMGYILSAGRLLRNSDFQVFRWKRWQKCRYDLIRDPERRLLTYLWWIC